MWLTTIDFQGFGGMVVLGWLKFRRGSWLTTLDFQGFAELS